MDNALHSYQDDLQLIIQAAQQAGEIALPYFRGQEALDVKMKEGDSPVSAADYAVNAFLQEKLLADRPNYGWLSEETEDNDKAQRMAAQRTFVVDPIDGTRGFIEGRDMWCISIGIVENNRPVAGVLVCPARGEIYAASLSGGAWLNGKSLRLLPAPNDPLMLGGPRMFLDMLDSRTQTVFSRHPHVPSLAYRIAMVANGALSGTFIKRNAHDWDLAAADIILHEAGGLLLDEHGKKVILNDEKVKKPLLIASHPKISKTMLGIVEAASMV